MEIGDGKAVIFKMPVKRKGEFDFQRIHDLKANTIHKAYLSIVLSKKTLHGPRVPFFVDPYHFEQWKNF